MLNVVTVAGTRVLVNPRRSLLTTAVLSAALAFVPVFGALYWFAPGTTAGRPSRS